MALEMTPDDRQARYAARCLRVAEAIAKLPPYAQALVLKYRRHIELVGRGGPDGCATAEVEAFVKDVAEAFDKQMVGFKVVGAYKAGSGV